LKRILSWFRAHYDKLIAFVVLIGLLVSLVYLATAVDRIKETQAQDDREMARERIVHPEAADVDTNVFAEGKNRIAGPFQLQAWSNALFVPEDRILCMDCKRPIPINADRCPFCDAVNQLGTEDDPSKDADGDGIPNGWEKEHGFDPNDSADAAKDSDRDGFSNLEEYLGSSDPNDPNSYPPVEHKLRVVKINADPFKLRFKGVQRLPDETMKFQINLRGDVKTYFVRMNEEVEGFKIIKYDPKFEEREVEGIGGKRRVDVSEITLQRGEKKILLQIGKDVQYSEYIAELLFTLDKSKYIQRLDSEFEIKGKKYKVIRFDTKQDAVVIERLLDGEQFTIRRAPERE
jgi:hypothetical protein